MSSTIQDLVDITRIQKAEFSSAQKLILKLYAENAPERCSAAKALGAMTLCSKGHSIRTFAIRSLTKLLEGEKDSQVKIEAAKSLEILQAKKTPQREKSKFENSNGKEPNLQGAHTDQAEVDNRTFATTTNDSEGSICKVRECENVGDKTCLSQSDLNVPGHPTSVSEEPLRMSKIKKTPFCFGANQDQVVKKLKTADQASTIDLAPRSVRHPLKRSWGNLKINSIPNRFSDASNLNAVQASSKVNTEKTSLPSPKTKVQQDQCTSTTSFSYKGMHSGESKVSAPLGRIASSGRPTCAPKATAHSKLGFLREKRTEKKPKMDADLVDWDAQGLRTLSEEQKKVVRCAVEGESFFFTGAAGTGKSRALKEIVRVLNEKYQDNEVQVTAPTGIAAVALGGCTTHSFAGIGLGQDKAEVLIRRILSNVRTKSRWLDVRVLIIDEISMMSGELFDKLEHIARIVRNSSQPFGGIQVVLCGDFFQLPPISSNFQDQSPKKVSFCFQSEAWSRVIHHTICLTTVFRQFGDAEFIALLNEVRIGKVSDNSYAKLRACQNTTWNDSIEPTRLYPLKFQVEKENTLHLDKLSGKPVTFKSKDTTKYAQSNYLKALNDSCAAPAELVLKIGAQVILLKNLVEGELVNGSRGVVLGFRPQTEGADKKLLSTFYPIVEFENHKTKLIVPDRFSIKVGNEEVATREQVPLTLAWALSIHKAQGMTLSRVEISLKSIFEYGQAYVALSRVTCMAGLKILDSFSRDVFRSHPAAIEFYNSLQPPTSD
ncbi:ATP-dependent DNA helicase PIF1-like [Schistocerca gregaria]|uniref:ATP-dependent DNA helicase PIF1-like n=1 Tax=Schistocerca gregaria TaxID=7010 RepID=UPI00211E73A9|nr:ATP-dependent DNA helicase PIF1-like [Schistocerca gregaria]